MKITDRRVSIKVYERTYTVTAIFTDMDAANRFMLDNPDQGVLAVEEADREPETPRLIFLAKLEDKGVIVKCWNDAPWPSSEPKSKKASDRTPLAYELAEMISRFSLPNGDSDDDAETLETIIEQARAITGLKPEAHACSVDPDEECAFCDCCGAELTENGSCENFHTPHENEESYCRACGERNPR